VVTGTRVPVQYILELSDMGYNAESIHEEYPTVSAELVTEIIRSLRENRILKVAH
jgi:uncharacterized protein (DUF433 family)